MLPAWILSLVFASLVIPFERQNLRDGDLIFQQSRSAQSQAIERATHSKWGHMGMLVRRRGHWYVYEASGTVRFTDLQYWINGGRRGRYVIKRLRSADALRTPAATEKFRALVTRFEGRPYDTAFGWGDDRMYCSELVWKIYERTLGVRIGEPQKLRTFDLQDPVVRAKLRERYGKRIPLDEPVISPAAMFDSPLLESVGGG
jgi:hypothetical protein